MAVGAISSSQPPAAAAAAAFFICLFFFIFHLHSSFLPFLSHFDTHVIDRSIDPRRISTIYSMGAQHEHGEEMVDINLLRNHRHTDSLESNARTTASTTPGLSDAHNAAEWLAVHRHSGIESIPGTPNESRSATPFSVSRVPVAT